MEASRLVEGAVSFILILFVTFCLGSNSQDICKRDAPKTTASRTPGDNGFRIKIAGKPPPEKFTPGQVYTITINGTYPNQKLEGFMLVAVPQFARDEGETMGTFQHMPHGLTKFAEQCPHVVMHTYHHKKAGVEVLWTAPDKGAGCVEFRATVIEFQDIWYKDDGALTKFFCEDSGTTEDNMSPDMIPDCCACDTAKYMMEFEGIWSRQTHPRDFPRVTRLLHWSNIIGASHSKNYMVWQYGSLSTRGVREVCEFGYPRTLEQEMKEYSQDIRTVIRTSGIWVNLKQSRWAHFSVNRKHHLLSLLTMLGPSPDWCVGVSALNLCLPNCSWAGDMTIEMYPWDAGTDDGSSYMAPNLRSDPQMKIHRITNTYPSDPNSPFFGPQPIRPLALLKIKRMHPKPGAAVTCSGNSSSSMDEFSLYDAEKHTGGHKKGKCATTDWDDWSDCSTTCGVGIQSRRRRFLKRGTRQKQCPHTKLVEQENCLGVENECPDDGGPCRVTAWSEWSPCSVTCGKGMQVRRRAYYRIEDASQCGKQLSEEQQCIAEVDDCSKVKKNFTAICSLRQDIGNCRGSFERYYYDSGLRRCMRFSYTGCRGNNNRFLTLDDCRHVCEQHMNKDGPAKNRGKLEIVSPRAFITNVHIGKGAGSHEFTIHCRTDDRYADLQWQYNGGMLQPNSDKYIMNRETKHGYTHSRLTVTKVGPNDMGLYTCLNMVDTSQSAQRKIMIVSRPGDGTNPAVEIFNPASDPFTVRVRGGIQSTYFILECRIKDVSAKLQWQFNGKTIAYTPKKYALSSKVDGEFTTESLAVMRVTAADMGQYTCVKDEENLDTIQVVVVGRAMPPSTAASPLGNTTPARLDCRVSGWTPWTDCSASCGRGFRHRERQVLQQPQNGGKRCPKKLRRKKRCRLQKCDASAPRSSSRTTGPVDCEVSDWGPWTKCAKSCGDTIQERTRRVVRRPRRGGQACPPRLERRYCNLPRCPRRGESLETDEPYIQL